MGKFFTPRKISLFFAISFFLSIVVARNVFGIWINEGSGGYGQALQETGINLEQFSLYNLSFTGMGLTKSLVGYPAASGGTASRGSALATLTGLTGNMLIYKPVSGVQYLADLGRNWGIVKTAYAQQTGYAALDPVKTLWQVARNISYLAFVLIFVVIGFMIMLRTRIDPRTVATVQTAIPGIVISLVLVTFSYAIAGLIIDIVNLSIDLTASVFQSVGLANTSSITAAFNDHNQNMNIFTIFSQFLTRGGNAAANIIKQIVDSLNLGVVKFLESTPGLNQMAEHAADWIIGLFFGLLIVMIMFRVFLMLLSALVTIIMLTIISPFQFLAAAIPGRGGAIFGWLKSMLTAGLTFPLTFILLLIAALFLGVNSGPFQIPNLSPLHGQWNWFPIPLGNVCKTVGEGENATCDPEGANLMSELIGIGILMFMPKVNDVIRSAFEVKTPPWAGAPGEAIGGGMAALKKILPI